MIALTSLAFVVSLTVLLLIWPSPAHAYLDPGTGSLVLTTILGGVAGLMVLIKMTWNNILTFLGIRKQKINDKAKENDGGFDIKSN